LKVNSQTHASPLCSRVRCPGGVADGERGHPFNTIQQFIFTTTWVPFLFLNTRTKQHTKWHTIQQFI
jgi:hypothetical protein